MAREHQFRVTGHRLIISGICSDCRAARTIRTRLDLDLSAERILRALRSSRITAVSIRSCLISVANCITSD